MPSTLAASRSGTSLTWSLQSQFLHRKACQCRVHNRQKQCARLKLTLQKLPPLRCRSFSCGSFDDLESQVGSFPLEIVDLQLAVLRVVELRSFVHELHPVAQHTVDQSGQLGRHSLNCNRSPEPASQSAKLRSQIRIA